MNALPAGQAMHLVFLCRAEKEVFRVEYLQMLHGFHPFGLVVLLSAYLQTAALLSQLASPSYTPSNCCIGSGVSCCLHVMKSVGARFCVRWTADDTDSTAGREPSQAEPGRAGPSRDETRRDEPSRAEPSRAEPSRAEPSRAEPSRAEPSRAKPSRVTLPAPALILAAVAGRHTLMHAHCP